METSQLPANQWVHVAVTLGNGTATLYVNGEVAASADGFTVKPSDFNPVNNYIGNSQWPDPLLNGMIDEFFVYNYALSAEEISAIYNGARVGIDDSLLIALLEEARTIDTELHTEESVEALEAAVSAAEQTTANAHASQEEIDAASADLLAVLQGLQWKDVTAPGSGRTGRTQRQQRLVYVSGNRDAVSCGNRGIQPG